MRVLFVRKSYKNSLTSFSFIYIFDIIIIFDILINKKDEKSNNL